MAIVCRRLRLLFIQAPRTGCTALEQLLVERFGGELLPAEHLYNAEGHIRVQRKHCSIRQLLEEGLIPADYRQQFTTATTVRNPFDSLVSLYVKKRDKYQELLSDPSSWIYQVRGYVEDMEFCRTHTFEEWLKEHYAVGTFDRLRGKGRRSLSGRYTQGVEIVMRFERLQADFEAMMRGGLGVTEDVTIPSVNITSQRKGTYRSYYSSEARRLVEYVFKQELDAYGYTFEGLDESTATSQRVGSVE